MDIKVLDFLISRIEKTMPEVLVHGERTASLCYVLAKELDLDNDDLEIAYMSGLLHEVGKIDIYEGVQLNGNNVDIEQLYPYFTISILNNFPGFEKLSTVIMQHQENINGSGTPIGLKDEQIDLLAKILRIADYYDTQRSKGLSHDDTTKLLRQYSDIYFPRKIITPFIKSVIKNELQFEYEE